MNPSLQLIEVEATRNPQGPWLRWQRGLLTSVGISVAVVLAGVYLFPADPQAAAAARAAQWVVR